MSQNTKPYIQMPEDDWVSVKDALPPAVNKFGDSAPCQVAHNRTVANSFAIAWYNYNMDEWVMYHFKATNTPIKVTHWKKFYPPTSK